MVLFRNAQYLVLPALCVAALAGCNVMNPGIPGSGNIQQESREVGEFSKVSFAGSAKILIESGAAEQACILSCDDNLLPLIETQIVDGELQIRTTKNIAPTKTLNITISTAHLTALECAGSCEASLMQINEPTLTLEIAGSGEVLAEGKASRLVIAAAGSMSLNTLQLEADQVEIEMAGSGAAKVNAKDQLSVEIAGSGDVRYLGEPKVKKSIAGVGKVAPINLADSKPSGKNSSDSSGSASSQGEVSGAEFKSVESESK